MCSNQGYEPIKSDPVLPSLKSHPQKCMKCDKPGTVIARTKDPFCSDCFCAYFIQRFRTTLGKLRVLKPREKVLLAFSGGPSSRALLQVVEHSIGEHAGKRLQIIPSILFIDEGAVLKKSPEERCRVIVDVLSIAQETKLESFYVPLEQVFSPTRATHSLSGPSSDHKNLEDTVLSILHQYEGAPLTQLLAVCENFSSLTARENFMVTLRQRLLTEVAERNGFTKVFVGDNATKVSVRLLSNIAQGRGATLPLDTGAFDDRNREVAVIRPLREFPEQEIMDYISVKNLKVANIFTSQNVLRLTLFQKTSSTIESTAGDFIRGLQANFPSTVNTIFRTAEKLSVPPSRSVCDLCKAPLLQLPDESVFEHLPLSTEMLCYGCKLTVKDMVDAVDYLPTSEDQSSNQ